MKMLGITTGEKDIVITVGKETFEISQLIRGANYSIMLQEPIARGELQYLANRVLMIVTWCARPVEQEFISMTESLLAWAWAGTPVFLQAPQPVDSPISKPMRH